MKINGEPPKVLTFDCYGTLIHWDEGLVAATKSMLQRHGRTDLDAREFLVEYGEIEYRIEQTPPYHSYCEVVSKALPAALERFGVVCRPDDVATLVDAVPTWGPFPEVPAVLERLRESYPLAIISNTDDELIMGNVERLGVPIDHVITAQQARAYKPSRAIFEYAYEQLKVDPADTVHICASPILDLPACRDLGLRCIWINRIDGQKPPADFEPDAELNDLRGVPDLVGVQ